MPRNRTRASGSDSSLAQLPLPHPPPPPRYGPERLLELRRSGGPRRRPEPWTAALWVKAPRASCPAAPSSAALASPGVGPEIGWRPLTPPAWPPVLWGPQPPNGGLAQSSMAAGPRPSPKGRPARVGAAYGRVWGLHEPSVRRRAQGPQLCPGRCQGTGETSPAQAAAPPTAPTRHCRLSADWGPFPDGEDGHPQVSAHGLPGAIGTQDGTSRRLAGPP